MPQNFAVRQYILRTLVDVFLYCDLDQSVSLCRVLSLRDRRHDLSTMACRFRVGIFSLEQAAVTAPQLL